MREEATHVTGGHIVKSIPGKPGHSSMNDVDPLKTKEDPLNFIKITFEIVFEIYKVPS